MKEEISSKNNKRSAKQNRSPKELQLLSAIGFSGKVINGLHAQKDGGLVYPVGVGVGICFDSLRACDHYLIGKVINGLHAQKDGGLVYPVGVGVGIWDRRGNRHSILHGHNHPVTALSVSKSGKLVVSAQNSDPGCLAKVVVWDYAERKEIGFYTVHREEIAAVDVTAGDQYVASLGGILDGYLVLWDVKSRKPICSMLAGEPGLGTPTILHAAPLTSTLLIVGGLALLRAWTLQLSNNRLTPTPISVGLLERNYTCLQIDDEEKFLYAATTTGDVVKIRLNMENGKAVSGGPILHVVMAPKYVPTLGGAKLARAPTPVIQTFLVLSCGDILVGDLGGSVRAYRQEGDIDDHGRPLRPPSTRAHGTVKYTHPKDPTRPLLKQLWTVDLGSPVTSLSFMNDNLMVSTFNSEIQRLQLLYQQPPTRTRINSSLSKPNKQLKFKGTCGAREKKTGKLEERLDAQSESHLMLSLTAPESSLLSTCHSEPIYDVTFPSGVGELVVTAGNGGVRVWNVRSLEEVLRVQFPGLICCCCHVTHTLQTIVSGWSDGRLRGLGAETGRVVWVVDDAHYGGVNTVITLRNGSVISGGCDGRVRVWIREGLGMRMTATQKEHRGEVTHLSLNDNQEKLLSCSGDGSCILWKLPSLDRIYNITAHTVFLGGVVLTTGEMVTVGSDGSVLVWERHDGALLADLPVSIKPITTVTATSNNSTLVTAGEDAMVRVWNWDKGRVSREGRGHSGAITRVSISPDGKVLASVGKDGALLFWKMP